MPTDDAAPGPQITVKPPVEPAEEVIRQDFRHGQLAAENVEMEFLADLIFDASFQVVDGCFADRHVEEVLDLRQEGFKIVVGDRRFAVTRVQHRQAALDLRLRNSSILAERTNPSGTTRPSRSADASVR